MNGTPAALAESVMAVPQSRIRELSDIAMSMDGVLKLYFGESNQPTPRYIKDAAIDAINQGFTFYAENAGFRSLRRAIADKYAAIHGIGLDPERHIVVSASGVQAMNLVMRCLLDPGDEAVILTPAWPNTTGIAALCSARAVQVPYALRGNCYGIDFAAVESSITPATRAIVYTSPSNPLGWVATEMEQERLVEICRGRGLWLVADEVYERLYYDGPVAPTVLHKCGREDHVVVVQSFSKSYCMTGWRLGWLVANSELARKAAQVNEYVVSHAPSMLQKAAETALHKGEEEIRVMVARLRENRDYVASVLQQLPGVTVPQPRGAFYFFLRIQGLRDSFEFCRRLLVQEKVGVAPGIAFGAGGEGSIRICFAADRAVLEPALERIDRFIRNAPR